MSLTSENGFTLTACGRCDEPVWRGWWGGFDMRLGRWTVPLRHALVLQRYGRREVVVVERRPSGRLQGMEFEPRAEIARYRAGERRMYAINHVCGTRHDPRKATQ